MKTLKVRIKDKHSDVLNRMAFECNQVWNSANAETSEWASVPIPEAGWVHFSITAYDLAKQQAKTAKERGLTLHSGTIQEVTEAHAKARKHSKKSKLRWRVSGGSKRSLGWVPFKKRSVKWVNGCVRYNGHYFQVWDSYGLSQYDFRSGSFSQDARGRWYFNVVVEFTDNKSEGTSAIGIDLGLKTVATCSDGEKMENTKIYRGLEKKLGIAQRANKKKAVKTIHAKIKNRRMDAIHKFTNKLTKQHGMIVIGDISSSKLAKTKMAKSVLDAGWHIMKTQLKYKAIARSVEYMEVGENYTTQACSSCGAISCNSPKGMAALGIREWVCAECGALHDRDINAAKNILAAGHRRLAVGISCH